MTDTETQAATGGGDPETGQTGGESGPETTDPDGSGDDGRLPAASELDWRRGARIAGFVALLAVVAPFVVYAVPQLVGAEYSYVVLSGSMAPAFGPGDVIVVNEVDPERIETGDVITFASDGDDQPTTHRVVEVVEAGDGIAFRTEGDANEDPDPALVQPSEVQGRVMEPAGTLAVFPHIGHVIWFADTDLGFLTLVGLPLGLFVLFEVRDVVASTRRSGSDGSTASGEAATTAEPEPEEGAPETAAEEDVYAIRPADVRFTSAVLVLFAAYGVWVAYATTEAWAVAVAASVGVAALLVSAVYLFGGGGSSGAPEAGSDRSSLPGEEVHADD